MWIIQFQCISSSGFSSSRSFSTSRILDTPHECICVWWSVRFCLIYPLCISCITNCSLDTLLESRMNFATIRRNAWSQSLTRWESGRSWAEFIESWSTSDRCTTRERGQHYNEVYNVKRRKITQVSSSAVPSNKGSDMKRRHDTSTYFCSSHSRLSRGQTFLVLSQREMQWKWKACWVKEQILGWFVVWTGPRYWYMIGIGTYIADTPSSGTLVACGGYLIGLAVDACWSP
jgi:hypothetical protein